MFDATLTHHYSMSMPGYTKLFNSILASTIWREDDKTRLVWITLLAMADKNGVAEGSIPGLADLARVSIEDCKEALSKLMSPDEYSRTVENEGRRIKQVEGGWAILNHAKYRAKMSTDERREYNRLKQQEFRKNKPSTRRQQKSMTVNDSQSQNEMSALSAHTKAEAKADPLLNTGFAVPACFEKIEGFTAALAGWIEHRKKLKKPVTGLAIQGLLDQLSKRPNEAVSGLKTAIMNGWQGFKWEWVDNHNSNSNGTSRQSTRQNPRVAGTANEGMCDQYAGIGRITGTGQNNGATGQ